MTCGVTFFAGAVGVHVELFDGVQEASSTRLITIRYFIIKNN
jgi:hypothetical protein